MRLRFYILSVLAFLISCTENVAPTNDDASLVVSSDAVLYVGNGSVAYVDVELSPESLDMTDTRSALSLEVLESNISFFQGTAPIFYTLSGLEKLKGEGNRYRVGIRDLNKGEKYTDRVCLVLKILTPEGTKIIKSQAFTIAYAGNVTHGLAFLKKDNPKAVIEDFVLDMTSSHITVSSPMITNPNLALSFTTDAEKVLVDGVEQVSGKTVNDYSKPVKVSFVSALGESKDYTIQVRHSGLPILFINTPAAAGIPPKTADWLANTNLTVYDVDCSIAYSGTAGIRGRGNSTWKYPKKPYALKLDSKAEILGMPKHKRWVLLANWLDRTLLRNHVAFHIAMQTGLDWTPRGHFVEVVLNGDHIGNYYLCEHIKVDKNRVDIDELDAGEVDGGYIMEVDSYYDETFKFKSAVKGFPYMFKDPDEVDDAQFAFMQEFIDNLENSLYDTARLRSGEYAQYLDIDSFVDWWIVYELTGNTETRHPKSTYVHKDKGGKLKAGPVWDFDWKTFRPENDTWVTKNHLYYDAFFADPVFVAKVKERWNLHKEKLRAIPAFIESEAEYIRNSESINHQMWPVTQNTNGDISLSFNEAVQRMVASYETKFEFMDREISVMEAETPVEQTENLELGISQALFGSLSKSEASSLISVGVKYIEVTINTFWRGYTLEECYKRARDTRNIIEGVDGLEVWSVHLPFSADLDISLTDDAKRAANVETMAEMIRLAGEFKPKKLVLHPSSEPISDADREKRLLCAEESIGKLLPVAKEIGAQLCIENLPRTCLGRTSDEIRRLIEDYPEVMVCFDSNHLLIEDHTSFFNNVGERIGTIHASDYDKTDERHWLMGKGIVDWPLFLKNLKYFGYEGVFMTEVKSGTPADVANAYKTVVCAE